MNDRALMPSAMPAHLAEKLSDRVTELPGEHEANAVSRAVRIHQAAEVAYAAIRDGSDIGDAIDEVRDGGDKQVAFDGQMATLMTAFPKAFNALNALPGSSPERLAMTDLFQAVSRIERMLYVEAFEDATALLDHRRQQ